MASLTLINPTALARTGSTKGWASLANSIGSDDVYATSGTYLPGDKSQLLRLQIQQPASPVLVLPPTLELTVEAQIDTDTGLETWIVDDDVRLGTLLGGPAGTQKSGGAQVPHTDGFSVYSIPTNGITLDDLNSGQACVFLGWKATPDAAFNPADWTVTVSGVGTIHRNGAISGDLPWTGAGPWAFDTGNGGTIPVDGSSIGTATIRATTTLASKPPYVPLDVRAQLSGGGAAAATFPNTPVYDVRLDDGLGHSGNYTVAQSNDFTTRELAPLVGVNYDVVVVGSAYSGITAQPQPLGSARATGSVQYTGSVVQPTASTLKLDSVSVTYAAVSPPPGGGAPPGPGGTSSRSNKSGSWKYGDGDRPIETLPAAPPFENPNGDYEVPETTEPKSDTYPNGFESQEARDELARRVARMIDDADASVKDLFEEYEYAQKVYDDEETPSSIEWDEAFEPYNVPLMQQRLDQIVTGVCSAFDRASPYFVLAGGDGDEDSREAAEKDLHDALQDAEIGLHTRTCALNAAFSSRGPFKAYWDELKREKQMSAQHAQGDPKEETSYAGIVIEPIEPGDFKVYPAWSRDLSKAILIGDVAQMTVAEVKRKQLSGEWYGDPDQTHPGSSSHTPPEVEKAAHDRQIDRPVDILNCIVKYAPTGPDGEDLFAPRYWECVVNLTARRLLLIRPYTLPRPWYFAPMYLPRRGRLFWQRKSIATRMITVQALSNDAYSGWVYGMARGANPTVLASNFTADAQNVRTGMGSIIGFRGNPNFVPIPAPPVPQSAPALTEQMERSADGISRASQLAAGQQLQGNATATEADALMQGANAGVTEYRLIFMAEMAEFALFALHLLGANYKSWKAYKGTLQSVDRRCLTARYRCEINSKSAYSSPQSQIQAVQTVVEAAKNMNIQPAPTTLQVDTAVLLTNLINALPIAGGAKVLVDEQPAPEPLAPEPSVPDLAPGGEIPPEALLAHAPPELLAALLGASQGGLPAYAPGGPETGPDPAMAGSPLGM